MLGGRRHPWCRNSGIVSKGYLRVALFVVPLAGVVIGAGRHDLAAGVAFDGGFGIIAAASYGRTEARAREKSGDQS